jgi:hypothetical protein
VRRVHQDAVHVEDRTLVCHDRHQSSGRHGCRPPDRISSKDVRPAVA